MAAELDGQSAELQTRTPGISHDDSGAPELVAREVGLEALDGQHDEVSSHSEPDPSEDEILGDLLFHEIQEFEKREKYRNAEQRHEELHIAEGGINSHDYSTDRSVEVDIFEPPGIGAHSGLIDEIRESAQPL